MPDDEFYYPLQAADIFAYGTLQELRKGDKGWSEDSIYTDFLKSNDPAYGQQYYGELWTEADENQLMPAIIAEMVIQEKSKPK